MSIIKQKFSGILRKTHTIPDLNATPVLEAIDGECCIPGQERQRTIKMPSRLSGTPAGEALSAVAKYEVGKTINSLLDGQNIKWGLLYVKVKPLSCLTFQAALSSLECSLTTEPPRDFKLLS
jgi:hypothetical protein